LFVVGTHSKKRPDNVVFARCFAGEVMDMVEMGVESVVGMAEFKVGDLRGDSGRRIERGQNKSRPRTLRSGPHLGRRQEQGLAVWIGDVEGDVPRLAEKADRRRRTRVRRCYRYGYTTALLRRVEVRVMRRMAAGALVVCHALTAQVVYVWLAGSVESGGVPSLGLLRRTEVQTRMEAAGMLVVVVVVVVVDAQKTRRLR
jgi:hypothetical protein